MNEIVEILKNLDWSPFYISIKTGIAATIVSFFLGIFAAQKIKGSIGWDSYTSACTSTDGCRFFSASDF